MRIESLSCRYCGKTINRGIKEGRDVLVCRCCKAVYEVNKRNNYINIKTLYYDFKQVC